MSRAGQSNTALADMPGFDGNVLRDLEVLGRAYPSEIARRLGCSHQAVAAALNRSPRAVRHVIGDWSCR